MKPKQNSAIRYILKNRWLYLLLIPGFAYIFIFNYIPMYGVLIAFKNFSFRKGIWGSDWIGLANFAEMFASETFWNVLKNSILLSLYRLAASFPFPILLALLLNEVKHSKFKKITQTVLYLPHFVSWVIFAGMIQMFLSPSEGAINLMIKSLGGEPIMFIQKSQYFRSILVISGIIKSAGWGTIIYLAAIASIDQDMYEAAIIDGANRLKQAVYITLPSIAPTICILLLMDMGRLLSNGFEQVHMLLNPLVYDVGDIIETYVYRIGLGNARYSYTTAVGLFQSFAGMALIIAANNITRRLSDNSLY
ncbi:MAG: ABC transporter permease subunit [Clostridiales bacterium]|jgi:putative aldouronate transport system permease protein|nr:ABC transporter permease subunit [Clostridiales bacterium]